MIDAAYLESDEGGWVLVIDDLNGTHHFPCDPALVEAALQPWKMHMLEGEIVRQERVAAGNVTWGEFKRSQARTDPEWSEQLAESADFFRKYERENRPVILTDRDPGDESDAA